MTKSMKFIRNLLKSTKGAVIAWVAVFLVTIGLIVSVYMLGGQSNIQSTESSMQNRLRQATAYYAKEFIRWRLDRYFNVAAPSSNECDVDDPRSCSLLNRINAPYVGGAGDRNDSTALSTGKQYIAEIIAVAAGLEYKDGVVRDGSNQFCVTSPKVISREGREVLSVSIAFPQESDYLGETEKFCDCNNVDLGTGAVSGKGCQTVTSERLIGYTNTSVAEESGDISMFFVFDASGQAANSGLGDEFAGTMAEIQTVLNTNYAVNLDERAKVGSNLYAQQTVCSNGVCGCAAGGESGKPICGIQGCGVEDEGDRIGDSRPGGFRNGGGNGRGDETTDFSGCIYSQHEEVAPEGRYGRGGGGCERGDDDCRPGSDDVIRREPDRHRLLPFEIAFYATPDMTCAGTPDNGPALHNNEVTHTTWTYKVEDLPDPYFCKTQTNEAGDRCLRAIEKCVITECGCDIGGAYTDEWTTEEEVDPNEASLTADDLLAIAETEEEGCSTITISSDGTIVRLTGADCGGGGGADDGGDGDGDGGGGGGGGFGGGGDDGGDGNGGGDDDGGFGGSSSGGDGRSIDSRDITCTTSCVDKQCDGQGQGEETTTGAMCDCQSADSASSYRKWFDDRNEGICWNKENYQKVTWYKSCPHQVVVETARNPQNRAVQSITQANGDEKCSSHGCIVKSRVFTSPKKLLEVRIRHIGTGRVINGTLEDGAITDVQSWQDEDGDRLRDYKLNFPSEWGWECDQPRGYSHQMTQAQGEDNFTRISRGCLPTGNTSGQAKEYKSVFIPEGCNQKTGEDCDLPLGEYEMYVFMKRANQAEEVEIIKGLVSTKVDGSLPSYQHNLFKDVLGKACPNGVCNSYEGANKACINTGFLPGTDKRIAQVDRADIDFSFPDGNDGAHLGSIGIEGVRITPTQTIHSLKCSLAGTKGADRNLVFDDPFANRSILSGGQGVKVSGVNRTIEEDVLACNFRLYDLSCVTDPHPETEDKTTDGLAGVSPVRGASPIGECAISPEGWGCAQEMLYRIHTPAMQGGYRIFKEGHEALAICQGISCSVNAAIQYHIDNPDTAKPMLIPFFGCPMHKCETESGGKGVAVSKFADYSVRWSAYSNNKGTPRFREGQPRIEQTCSSTSGTAYGQDSATDECLINQSDVMSGYGGVIFPIAFCPIDDYGLDIAKKLATDSNAAVGNADSYGYIPMNGSQAVRKAALGLAKANLAYAILVRTRPELGVEVTQGAASIISVE